MRYDVPTMEQVGVASELIQAYLGPRYDGDGYTWSYGAVCSPLEEE
jgi:hypothetical protein